MNVVKKIKKIIKNNRNISMICTLVLIICCYIFFFSSKFIFNHKEQYKFSEINSVIEIDNREITLAKWIYCPSDNKMEIEFDINNKNYDGNDEYLVEVIDRKGNKYAINKVIEAPVMVVAQVSDIPEEWTELRVSISVQNEESKNVAKWYTNKDVIEYAEKIITYNSLDEYYAAKLDRYITGYEKEIEDIQNKILDEEKKIENYNSIIDNLSKQKLFAAGDELAKIVEQINDTNILIISSNSQIKDYEKDIEDIRSKISDYKAIKDVYENYS